MPPVILIKGSIRAKFPDTPNLTESPWHTWVYSLRPFIGWAPSCPIYTDASWRALQHPKPSSVRTARVPPGTQGPFPLGRHHRDWCSNILAVCFEIPPSLKAFRGTAQVADQGTPRALQHPPGCLVQAPVGHLPR